MTPTIKIIITGLLLSVSTFVASAQTPSGIVLHPEWATSIRDNVETMKELKSLLSHHAKPSVSTDPQPGLTIYKDITYLMPLEAAIKALGVSRQVSTTSEVICPGFPYHSLLGHSFNGTFEGEFETVYIVTDLAQHVVAVQFVTGSPKEEFDDSLTDKEWSTFDFVNTKRKAISTARVMHKTHGMAGHHQHKPTRVLQIESTFFSPVAPHNNLKAKYQSRLYLPRPMVELILFRISQSLG
ncbi:MAG: hypothetical protein WCO60_02570 [Verrucomicrobiota bacterium]